MAHQILSRPLHTNEALRMALESNSALKRTRILRAAYLAR